MKVGEVMCRSAKTINANETLKRAAQLMAAEDVGFLPVEEDDRLIGMLTDRDIVTRCIAQGKDGVSRVRDAMTKDVKYCFEDEDLDEVMDNMADLQVRRLPVMSNDKRLVGILSLGDIAVDYGAKKVGQTLEEISENTPAAH